MRQRRRLLFVLWVAGGVSVACKILSAEPTAVGRAVAAWPPVALLLVVEVLARSTLPTGRLRWASAVGAAAVAVVAAFASFHHMHAVALSVGESVLVAWLFPFSVDGLAVVASVALVGTHRPDDPAPDSTAPESVAQVDPVESPPVNYSPAGASLFVPPTGVRHPVTVYGTGPNPTTQPTQTMR